MWTRGELKEKGMAAFKANYWKCVLVALIISLVSGGLSSGSSYKSSGNITEVFDEIRNRTGSGTSTTIESDDDSYDYETDFDDSENNSIGNNSMDVAAIAIIIAVVFVVVLICMVIGMAIAAFLLNPIIVGCNRFFVKNLDEPAGLNNLSRGFEGNYMNVVKVNFFRDLYLFLWALIPVAGIFIAIVKKYEYMMIPYLLADDPDMDKDEAFALTKEMMDGQKWNAFVLALSFIGWHLLGICTIGILEIFYVKPYESSTFAALYETLSSGYTDNGIADNNSGYIEGTYTNV
jgi:uncharacterized membrane protein